MRPVIDRPPGRFRYVKAAGHFTMHAATGEAPVTPRECGYLSAFAGRNLRASARGGHMARAHGPM
jgi:hypothetical protein